MNQIFLIGFASAICINDRVTFLNEHVGNQHAGEVQFYLQVSH